MKKRIFWWKHPGLCERHTFSLARAEYVTFPYVDMFVIIFDLGIQSEGLREIAGEVHKLFILNGRPWSGSCTDDEYIDSRFMFLQFLTNFAVQHWKVTNTYSQYHNY